MTATLLLVLLAADPQPPAAPPADPDYEALLNDRAGKGITPETNANALLWKAFGPTPEGGKGMPAEYFKRLGIPEPPKEGDYFVGQSAFARDRLKLDQEAVNAFYDEQGRASQRPWKAADFPRVAAWLALNEKPLAVVTEATKRPVYFNPLVSNRTGQEPGMLIGALLPNVQKGREFASALTARAMLRTGEGQLDAAWQDLLACHRLGVLVGRGATLIEGLVGIAIEAIATNAELAYLDRADLTAAQLRARLKDVDALPPTAPAADKIDLGERYLGLDALRHIRRGSGLGLMGGPERKLTPEEQKAWAALDWGPVIADGNSWYDRMSAAMRLPTRADRRAAFAKLNAEVGALKKKPAEGELLLEMVFGKGGVKKMVAREIGNTLFGLLLPAVEKVQDANDRAVQVRRNLRVAFALAIYRKDTGAYPAKLAALAPKYLPAVPGDEFTGKELVYRTEGAGYVLYSLGANGKDDGGRWHDDDPPGDDPRVRMPLPELKKPK